MSITITKEENGLRIATTVPGGMIDLAADGFGPSLIGYPTMKLTFFQQRMGAEGDPTQYREVVSTVSVPTAAFLEFADIVRKTLSENKEVIRTVADQMLDRMERQ